MSPVIIVGVSITIVLSVVGIIILKRPPKRRDNDPEISPEQVTANEFINVKDIRDNFLYTSDGMALTYLRIHAISIELFSKSELRHIIAQLTAELQGITYPIKLLAIPRPVDISRMIDHLSTMAAGSSGIRKKILRQELAQMNEYALGGDIIERQFFFCLWERVDDDAERILIQRTKELIERFSSRQIKLELLGQKEIVRLVNLVHNPSYMNIEDTDHQPYIPILNREDLA